MRLKDALWADSGLLWIALGLSFVTNVFLLATPIFVLTIYDSILTSGSIETLSAMTALIVVAVLVWALSDYARKRVLARFGARFQERMESISFDAQYQQRKKQPGVNRQIKFGTGDLNSIRSFFHSYSLVTIFDLIWSPIFIIALYIINPKAALISCIAIIVILAVRFVGDYLNSQREKVANRTSNLASSDLSSYEMQAGTILNLNMVGSIKRSLIQDKMKSRDSAVSMSDGKKFVSAMISFINRGCQTVVIAFSAYAVIGGKLTIGGMVASVVLSRLFVTPASSFFKEIPKIISARKSWKKLEKILDEYAKEAGSRLTSFDTSMLLNLENVTVQTLDGSGKLFDNLDLDVKPREVIQILGGSGAGKTVLQKIISGAIIPDAGVCKLQGTRVDHIPPSKICKILGVVDEQRELLTGTIARNIAQFSQPIDSERVNHVFKATNSRKYLESLPMALNTKVYSSNNFLSLSERTAICLCRALYYDPELIVIDQPDIALVDLFRANSESIFLKLKEQGKALIILSSIPIPLSFDRTLRIEQGVLKEDINNVSRIANYK